VAAPVVKKENAVSGETEGASPDPAAAKAEAGSAAMAKAQAVEENLGPAAKEYLRGLLVNIRTMLTYVNATGIGVPAELREKLDDLMKNPALDKYGMTPALTNEVQKRRGGWWPWPKA
jgi:hypothetical protein